MRSSTTAIIFVFSFFFALVFSTVSADSNTTNTTSSSADACSQCWVSSRKSLQACLNIPDSELSAFANTTDETLAQNSANFPTLVPCLCALAEKAPSLLSNCAACSGAISSGLQDEATYVAEIVCGKNVTAKTNGKDLNDGSSSSSSSPNSSSSPDANGDVNASSYSDAASLSSSLFSLTSLTLTLVAALITAL
ncbi:6243_t:CDS:1 [Ambispora leptoticha]|uniref:6243_t:CDS:1 n=1 Tax=Ambispora leptoticha TaxID=144679 RepID=A0A9N8VBZ2_9GLOM|nr:6243_t:CDS:1 [Ambispora leptoticha]